MKLLLDELLSATIAAELRTRGPDVVALQDPGLEHLRGVADRLVLDHAARESRAVVTDNVPDFLACHRQMLASGGSHAGLLFFGNDRFPRHRPELFVSHLLAALEGVLRAHPDDDGSSWIRWLA